MTRGYECEEKIDARRLCREQGKDGCAVLMTAPADDGHRAVLAFVG